MIFFIIAAGLIIRLISLNQSLWLDEATTALVSRMSFSDILNKFLPGDFHPPFYYLLMKFWTTYFGYSEISLRIPSVLFGLGTVYVTYLISKKIFDKKVGLLASILVATSGLFIYYSQEARMYALAAFLVSLTTYFFIEKKWIVFSIIMIAVGMTDYVSLFVVPVFFVSGLKNWKKLFLSLIPLAVSFTFWLPVFTKQILAGLSLKGSNWWNILGTPTFKNLALIPIKFILGRISFDNKTLYFAVVAASLCLFGYVLLKSLKAPRLLWMWLILPVVVGVVASFKVPSLTYFRFLFCLTPLYILLAYGAKNTGKLSMIVSSMLIIFNAASSGYYLFNPKFHREDWRGAVRFVESRKVGNSITVFSQDSNWEAYRYYAPNAKIAGPAEIKPGYSQIWLMGYLSSVFDPAGSVRQEIEFLGYVRGVSYTFNGVGEIYLYEE